MILSIEEWGKTIPYEDTDDLLKNVTYKYRVKSTVDIQITLELIIGPPRERLKWCYTRPKEDSKEYFDFWINCSEEDIINISNKAEYI